MPSPVTPNDVKAVIPAANSELCVKLSAVLQQLPELIHKLVSWMFNPDGTVSDAFKAEVGVAAGGLPAPGSVTATDGTDATKITVTWQAAAGATSYEVYRSTTNDTGTAGAPIAVNVTVTSYQDTPPAANTQYFYWVKARNSTSVSGFSQSDAGYAGSTGAASGLVIIDDTPPGGVFKFPGQATAAAEIHIWAGGGGGGGWRTETFGNPLGASWYGGGGGGSGEYRVLTGVTIGVNEVLNILVGSEGVAGHCGSGGSGDTGGTTTVQGKNGGGTVVTLAQALGGAGGTQGNNSGLSSGAGVGGAGGTGGTGGTPTNGNAGANGALNKVGGVGGAALIKTIGGINYSAGAGGKGCEAVAAGSKGKVIIKW